MKKKLIIGSLILLLITLIILILTHNIEVLDDEVHKLLYSDNLVEFMKIITFFGGYIGIPIIGLIIAIILFKKNKKRESLDLVIILVLSTLINIIIKLIVGRSRPEYILVNESMSSFPSGHAMGSTALYGYLIYLVINSNLNNKNKAILSTLLVILIISIGVSRIILGAHYFSDIIGGIIISTLIIIIHLEINIYLKNKHKEKL